MYRLQLVAWAAAMVASLSCGSDSRQSSPAGDSSTVVPAFDGSMAATAPGDTAADLAVSNSCSTMISRWQDYLADSAMVACAAANDCIVVGGQPTTDPCNGYDSIGYCGQAANGAAYRASPAASLETAFAANCKNHTGYDCGPGHATCANGKCTMLGWGCCLCRPDGGSNLTPDVSLTSSADLGETSRHETGGTEASVGE